MVVAIADTVICKALFHTPLPVQVTWLVKITPNYGAFPVRSAVTFLPAKYY